MPFGHSATCSFSILCMQCAASLYPHPPAKSATCPCNLPSPPLLQLLRLFRVYADPSQQPRPSFCARIETGDQAAPRAQTFECHLREPLNHDRRLSRRSLSRRAHLVSIPVRPSPRPRLYFHALRHQRRAVASGRTAEIQPLLFRPLLRTRIFSTVYRLRALPQRRRRLTPPA